MKRKLVGLVLVTFLVLAGCAQLQGIFQKIDTPEKQFLVAQKEVNAALREYKVVLLASTKEEQKTMHEKYDTLIVLLSNALDAWEQVVRGITLETGQVQEFLRIKNKLILAGWKYLEGGKK